MKTRSDLGLAREEEAEEERAVPVAKRDGFPAATLLAAGLGVFVLGLLTSLGEASESWNARLTLNHDVGALSGKSTWAVVAFAVSWVVLSALLWRRDRVLNAALVAFGCMAALGFLGTFPTFFQALE